MQVEVQAVAPEQVEADVVAVPLAGGDGLSGAAAALDSALDGLLGRLAGDGELRGEAGRAAIVHVDGKLGTGRVAVAGLGDRLDADALRTAAAAVAHETSAFAETLAWVLDDSLPVPADTTTTSARTSSPSMTAPTTREPSIWTRSATEFARIVRFGRDRAGSM